MMQPVSVIPDLHADPQRLEASLAATRDGQLAFLGDFIDAGTDQARSDDEAVLQRVHGLIEDGRAVAVMGNHELNAILFHRYGSDGKPLRSHKFKNQKQHDSFLKRFGTATPKAIAWTDWFLSLPLWLDLGGLRLVHACWDQAAIDTIRERRPNGRLHPDDLPEVATKSTPFARAVEMLTSGPEIRLPAGYSFHDVKENMRDCVRIAWWRAGTGTWREVALSVPDPDELPEGLVEGVEGVPVYPEGSHPVLVGHYKMLGYPRIETPQASCLDYPQHSCVYHWSGERELTSSNLKPCCIV